MAVAAGSKGSGLRPGALLANVTKLVPELAAFANLDLRVVYNKDSSNCGPQVCTTANSGTTALSACGGLTDAHTLSACRLLPSKQLVRTHGCAMAVDQLQAH